VDVKRPAPQRGLVLAAATSGFGVIQLDVSVVDVAVKPIGAVLGGGVTGLQWVVDAYTLTFAAMILTAGALGDRGVDLTASGTLTASRQAGSVLGVALFGPLLAGMGATAGLQAAVTDDAA
jgi:MFS transporter, DHA2 family, methylenomycin A resistance protein